MKLCEAISKRLRELMKERKLTQYALAIKTGVSQSTISAVLRSLHENPSVTVLYDIVTGLDISLAEFFASPLFQYENIVD